MGRFSANAASTRAGPTFDPLCTCKVKLTSCLLQFRKNNNDTFFPRHFRKFCCYCLPFGFVPLVCLYSMVLFLQGRTFSTLFVGRAGSSTRNLDHRSPLFIALMMMINYDVLLLFIIIIILLYYYVGG